MLFFFLGGGGGLGALFVLFVLLFSRSIANNLCETLRELLPDQCSLLLYNSLEMFANSGHLCLQRCTVVFIHSFVAQTTCASPNGKCVTGLITVMTGLMN